jgi:hypothetical protein
MPVDETLRRGNQSALTQVNYVRCQTYRTCGSDPAFQHTHCCRCRHSPRWRTNNAPPERPLRPSELLEAVSPLPARPRRSDRVCDRAGPPRYPAISTGHLDALHRFAFAPRLIVPPPVEKYGCARRGSSRSIRVAQARAASRSAISADTSVPEPSSLVALLSGLAGLRAVRWRRSDQPTGQTVPPHRDSPSVFLANLPEMRG